jgi:hypothetical protein
MEVGMWAKEMLAALALVAILPLQGMAEEPKKIQDNSFLLEEAYNQEPGVIQHIQTFQYLQKSKTWAYTFVQEWPVPKETHQLSYNIPVVHSADPAHKTGIGDIQLNYRYQAVLKDHIAFSPRFSVILPTGDYKKGFGTDSFGLQANLPLSVELTDKFVTHWNLGTTFTPRSREAGGAKADTTAFNYGASLIYLASENFNLMFEMAGTSGESVQPDGSRQQASTFFINPGVRFAINFKSGLQIVPGFSMPIGVGPSKGEYGGLGYLSFEHPLF